MDSWPPRPHPGPQTEFFSRTEFEIFYGGAVSGGKSWALVVCALEHISNPKYRAIIIRRKFPQLHHIEDLCWQMYPRFGGQYRAAERCWVFSSGARINLGHMQHEMDRFNFQGKEYHKILIDEAPQFTQTQYLYMFSRARSPDAQLRPQILCTGNPGGIGHRFIKERFIDIAEPRTVYIDPGTGLSRYFIPATVYDNPTILDNDPEYVKRLEALPEVERRQYLYGDWDIFEGMAFPELKREDHGCDPFRIPPEWTRFMTFDWGYSKPFAALWFAVDYDENLYVYRELYGTKDGTLDTGLKMTAESIAKKILSLEREDNDQIRTRLMDPSAFGTLPNYRTKETIHGTIDLDFQAAGLFFQKADNDRIQGKQQIHKRLEMGDEEGPKIKIFNNLRFFWEIMPDLALNESDQEDVDSRNQPDHLYDAFRYGCSFRPMRPKRAYTEIRGTFKDERRRLMRAKHYSKVHGVSIDLAYLKVK